MKWTCVLLTIVIVAFVLSTLEAHAANSAAVKDAKVTALIDGPNITFDVRFTLTTKSSGAWVDVARGDVVLEEVASPKDGYTLRYDPETKTYALGFAAAGTRDVVFRLAAKPQAAEDGGQGVKEATFEMPASRVRELEVIADRVDLEVDLLGAVRVKRAVDDGVLTITGVQGSERNFAVRWKPKVRDLDAELVFSTQANTIASVQSGALRVDTVVAYAIAQGKLESLEMRVPRNLSITQVRGAFIRDWRIEPGPEGGPDTLRVVLNRPQRDAYSLQVVGEATLGAFPVTTALPVIEPVGGIRSGGYLAVGTDSAIELVVKKAAGLSQIDAGAMPRIAADRAHPRPLPTGKAFYYRFASSSGYALDLSLDHIVPNYDSTLRLAARVGRDDLVLDAEVELDIRDAPLREVTLLVPASLTVVSATGPAVDDYSLPDATRDPAQATRPVVVRFQQPVSGRALIGLRLELGRSPLGQRSDLPAITVEGAATQRGHVAVAVEEGVELPQPNAQGMREVNTASVPLRVGGAQYAYRLRNAGWRLTIEPSEKPASVRVETFHLIALGEGVAYGNVALSYFITGSPIDELSFVVDPALRHVEFVGRDIRSARQDPADPTRYIVKLQRRVIGDYNLGITYSQRYADGRPLLAGGVRCGDVESQTGYLAIASHQNLTLEAAPPKASSLLAIEREELPANYRLLVGAPLLASYKHVGAAEPFDITVNAYDRGSLLPVVIEMAQMRTDLVPQDDGRVEASTTMTFKVKNSSGQFMALTLPRGAKLWTAHLIDIPRDAQGRPAVDERGQPVRKTVRINASGKQGKHGTEVLIPLRRPRDPNTPITIELVYGEVRRMNGLAGSLELASPTGSVVSTYDHWQVSVPADWAVHEAGSLAELEPRPQFHGQMSGIFGAVGDSWREAAEQVGLDGRIYWAVGAIFAVLLIVLLTARRALPDALIASLLAAALLLGIVAAGTSAFSSRLAHPDDLTTLRYSQVMSGDEAAPLTLSLSVVPTWRQYATVTSGIVVPIASAVLLLLAIRMKRGRKLLVAAGAAGLLYAACHIPLLSQPLGHLFTWGIPAVLLLALLWRRGIRRAITHHAPLAKPAPAALLLAAGLLAFSGCATSRLTVEQSTPILQSVELDLQAEEDAMSGTLRLAIDTDKPIRFGVFEPGAIVLSMQPESKHLELVQVNDKHQLVVGQAGRYNPTIRFLRPLSAPDAHQARVFAMPIPPAMTNRVSLVVPEAGYDIQSPSAIRLTHDDLPDATAAHAIMAHGQPASFAWKPSDRRRELEPVAFFASTIGVARFDSGIVEQRSLINLEIAQGQTDKITLKAPPGVSVTAVEGDGLGAWRFDPVTRTVEARLNRPATGQYRLLVVTQHALSGLPATVKLGRLEVLGAKRQRALLGLVHTPAVYLTLDDKPTSVNANDFTRDAAALLQPMASTLIGGVRHAARLDTGQAVAVTAHAVQPELRTTENASLTVSDERLIYNTALSLIITKAGRFSVGLIIPEGYDLDTLGAPQVSHWDEQTVGGRRVATVHFRQRTQGQVELQAALSRPVTDLPEKLEVPRLGVPDTLKHSGQLIVTAAQGVRIAVAGRSGVSELDPAALGIRTPGTLAFRLLRPDWALSIGTEVIEPVVDVDALQVARVSEGLVRHEARLRHTVRHAGVKVFDVRVPDGATGVVITGSQIARTYQPDENNPALYRVELSRKQMGGAHQAYQLTVRYETRFDRESGAVVVTPVVAPDADRQRGYVVVMASERVELAPTKASANLQPAEARTIPRQFGAGDLSNAALCYRASSEDYTLELESTRHRSADLLAASVRSAAITSVITEQGDSINRVGIELSVGGKRHLEAALPDGADIWSLLVNGRSSVPSIRTDSKTGRQTYLIPLRPDAAGELPVQIELVYAVESPTGSWSSPTLVGPRFDLPLHNVAWTLYAPAGYAYSDFRGTLTHVEDHGEPAPMVRYSAGDYEQGVERQNIYNLNKALVLQERGNKLASQGKQQAARQALESAWYYSQSDQALNEDARVQLHKLAREQALVGLVGNRGRLRQQAGVATDSPNAQALGDQFEREQAQRLRSSLSKADSENLDAIIARMIETQDAAAAAGVPIYISLPVRGEPLRFTRSILVEPNSPMQISFHAGQPATQRLADNTAWAIGVFLVLIILGLLITPASKAYTAMQRSLQPIPQEQAPSDEEPSVV